MRHQFLLGAAAVALVMPMAALAQETTSSIRGIVTANGAPVAGATVVAINTATSARNEVVTDAAGAFNLVGLLPGGPYTVEVTSPQGNTTVTDITTLSQQAFELPVALAATDANTPTTGDIVVTASSIAGAGTISSGPRTVLTQADIRKVASVNRDVRDLERRDPLALLDLTNTRAVSFAGVNPRFNRFTINGVQIGDNFGLQSDANPTGRGPVPFDAISQFSVSIAPSDIRQGNFQGGAIDTVLLSGSNEFHGTGFYSQNRDELTGDQIGSTRPTIGNFKSETYGATFSGPIIADKLFFMVSAERNTDPRPLIGASISDVPRLTADQVTQVQNIARTVYNYNAGGLTPINNQKDEKIVGRIDWNIMTGQRLSLSYVNAYESSTNVPNTSGLVGGTPVATQSYSLGLSSDNYQRSNLVRAGIVQLNSNWTDKFSTEARFLYKSQEISQTPLNGLGFAQFSVCTDATSIAVATTANNNNNVTSCGNGARVFLGPDASRQYNSLFFDTWGGSLQARYNAGSHDIKILAEYNRNRTTNGFLQNAAGVYYFDSLQDFQNRNASQFSYQNAVSLNLTDAASNFVYEQWTFGAQNHWQINDTLDITYGVRYDLYGMRSQIPGNAAFFARNGFYNTQTYKGLDNFQPRFSFNWKPVDLLRIRGTAAVFGGGSPDIYLSNSYSNTGITTNAINNLSRVTFTPGGGTLTCSSLTGAAANVCTSALNGVTGTSIPQPVTNYIATAIDGQRTAPVSALAPGFKPPSVTKLNLSADYTLFGFNVGGDYLYTMVNEGVSFTDLRSVVGGTLPDGRPRYTFRRTPGVTGQTTDNNGDYLLYNDGRGRSHVFVVRFDKKFDFGLSFGGSYAWQDVKDVSPATSSTPGSLYGTAAKADPNFPAYGVSSDEIKWAYKYNVGFDHAFFGDYKTTIQLFGETRAGRHYSFTMLDTAPTGVNCTRTCAFGTLGNNNAFLLYVPTSTTDPIVSYDSATTATGLDGLINNSALKGYRGRVSAKNIARNRAFTRIDLHLEQEVPTFIGNSRVSIFADIENLPNLLNSKWGGLRQLGFPYTSSPVRVQCLNAVVATGTTPTAAQISTSVATPCVQYRFSSFQAPNESALTTPSTNSLYQIRLGARFSF